MINILFLFAKSIDFFLSKNTFCFDFKTTPFKLAFLQSFKVSKPIVGGNWDERFKTDVINCGPQKNDAWCGNMPYHDTMTTRRSYFANILFLDEQIGLIINALKENNFINNTFIIFVSDHGDGQGDHYHWRKGGIKF